MNRAVRKRAAKLKDKALKGLGRQTGSDLRAVSGRLSQEQYVATLGWFERVVEESAVAELTRLAEELLVSTDALQREEIPRFAPANKLAEIQCGAGCAWCCMQPVQVSILSAIAVAAYLKREGQGAEVVSRLADYVSLLEPYENRRDRLKECHEPCPFLHSQGTCTVYPARPVLCRAFHSTDVACCRAVVQEKRANHEVPMFPNLFGFVGIRLAGARQAFKEMGIDDRPVVLAGAVKLLLDDFETTVLAWLSGDKVFQPAAVVG